MWTINSNDVEQAKHHLERRRSEIEARYTEEKSALDAEAAVIETLDRVAADFADRHNRESPGLGAPPAAPVEPEPEAGTPEDGSDGLESEAAPTQPPDPPAPEEMSGGFDILKPGSRWRLNRGNRLLNPENPGGGTTGTNTGSW